MPVVEWLHRSGGKDSGKDKDKASGSDRSGDSCKASDANDSGKACGDDWSENEIANHAMESIVRHCCQTNTILEVTETHVHAGVDPTQIALEMCRRSIATAAGDFKAVFLAPTAPQARSHFARASEIGTLSPRLVIGNAEVDKWNKAAWREIVSQHKLLITTPQLFLDKLNANFLELGLFTTLIVDECQNCAHNHPYAVLFTEHYHRASNDEQTGKIRVLGLSKCLVPRKVKSLEALMASHAIDIQWTSFLLNLP